MFASGLPTAEKPQAKRYYLMAHGPAAREERSDAWQQYQAYLRRTSILIPVPPVLYKRLPEFVKKTLFLDFPMYQFDEMRDGADALEEARERQESVHN